MSKHHRIPIWAGLLAAVTISLAHSSAPGDNSEAPVRALVNQMFEAYNRGDVSGASARFAPDGDMVAGDGTVVSTRAGIERFLSDLRAQLPNGTQFIATITNVRFAGPDVAIVMTDGGWRFPDEKEISDKNRGTQVAVAIRQKGEWSIALFQRTRKVLAAPKQQ